MNKKVGQGRLSSTGTACLARPVTTYWLQATARPVTTYWLQATARPVTTYWLQATARPVTTYWLQATARPATTYWLQATARQPLPIGCHHLPRQNIHIPLVRTEYSGSCLKFSTETAERRIAGDVVRVGYGEDCVDAAVAGN